MKHWIVALGLLAATGAGVQTAAAQTAGGDTAAGQVNNGPGIGPSEGLERPDLQQQENAARGRGSAHRLRSHHVRRPPASGKAATGADSPPG